MPTIPGVRPSQRLGIEGLRWRMFGKLVDAIVHRSTSGCKSLTTRVESDERGRTDNAARGMLENQTYVTHSHSKVFGTLFLVKVGVGLYVLAGYMRGRRLAARRKK